MTPRRSTCGLAGVCWLVVLLWLSLGSPSSVAQERSRPHLSLPADTGDPDVSPDGRSLVYRWWPSDENRWGLYVVPLSGGEPNLFVKDDERGVVQRPRWSPDGRWIAFLRSGSARGALLFVKSRMSGEERFLGLVCADAEAWAADGESVIAPSSEDVDSGNECEMTSFSIRAGVKPERLGLRGRLPALSRDGTTIAFVHGQEIALSSLTPAGRSVGAESTVVRASGPVLSLAWAVDGKELLYVLSSAPSDLRRVDAHAGSVARDALHVDGEVGPIAVTPEGDLIGEVSSHVNSIWAVDLATPKAHPFMVRKLPWNLGASTISPDSRRLVYSVLSGGASEIYMTNLSDGEPQRLFRVELAIEHLSWSPDGQQIAMVGETGSGPARPSHLLITSAKGSSPKSVLDQFGSVYQVAWSPDSSALFAVADSADSKGTNSIWKLKLADGRLTRIAEGGALQIEVSPDNRFLYLRRFPNNLVRVPIGGGTVDPVANGVLDFALSRDSVYVERQDSKPPAADGLNLYRIGADAPMSHFVTSVEFLPSSVTLPGSGGLLYMERREPVEERLTVLPAVGVSDSFEGRRLNQR